MPKDQPSGQKWQPLKINTRTEAHSQKQGIRQPQNRNIVINRHTHKPQADQMTSPAASAAVPNEAQRPRTPPRGWMLSAHSPNSPDPSLCPLFSPGLWDLGQQQVPRDTGPGCGRSPGLQGLGLVGIGNGSESGPCAGSPKGC